MKSVSITRQPEYIHELAHLTELLASHPSSEYLDFDVEETLDYVLDKATRILTAGITGEVSCRSRLSGMPDLTLIFTDPGQLEDCAFHPSVRYARWNKDKVVSFVPRKCVHAIHSPLCVD